MKPAFKVGQTVLKFSEYRKPYIEEGMVLVVQGSGNYVVNINGQLVHCRKYQLYDLALLPFLTELADELDLEISAKEAMQIEMRQVQDDWEPILSTHRDLVSTAWAKLRDQPGGTTT